MTKDAAQRRKWTFYEAVTTYKTKMVYMSIIAKDSPVFYGA